jgi:hypothetical protein
MFRILILLFIIQLYFEFATTEHTLCMPNTISYDLQTNLTLKQNNKDTIYLNYNSTYKIDHNRAKYEVVINNNRFLTCLYLNNIMYMYNHTISGKHICSCYIYPSFPISNCLYGNTTYNDNIVTLVNNYVDSTIISITKTNLFKAIDKQNSKLYFLINQYSHFKEFYNSKLYSETFIKSNYNNMKLYIPNDNDFIINPNWNCPNNTSYCTNII